MPDLPVILEAQPGQILTLGRAGESSSRWCYHRRRISDYCWVD